MALRNKDREWLSNDYRTALAERQAEEAALDAEIAEVEKQLKEGWPAELGSEPDLDGIRVLVAGRLIAHALEELVPRRRDIPPKKRDPLPKRGTSKSPRPRYGRGFLFDLNFPSHTASAQFLQAARYLRQASRASKCVLESMAQLETLRSSASDMLEFLRRLETFYRLDKCPRAAAQIQYLALKVEEAAAKEKARQQAAAPTTKQDTKTPNCEKGSPPLR